MYVVVMEGAGDKAYCAGGDIRGDHAVQLAASVSRVLVKT